MYKEIKYWRGAKKKTYPYYQLLPVYGNKIMVENYDRAIYVIKDPKTDMYLDVHNKWTSLVSKARIFNRKSDANCCISQKEKVTLKNKGLEVIMLQCYLP